MANAGDLTLWTPGQSVTAELVANADGTVGGRMDMVELVGEGESHPQVRTVSADGQGVGRLIRDAEAYDEADTYAAGEVVDTVEVDLNGSVDWYRTDDTYTPSVGDQVISAAGGGVRAYDADGTAPDDSPTDVFGVVWTTVSRGFGPEPGAVAVYRFR